MKTHEATFIVDGVPLPGRARTEIWIDGEFWFDLQTKRGGSETVTLQEGRHRLRISLRTGKTEKGMEYDIFVYSPGTVRIRHDRMSNMLVAADLGDFAPGRMARLKKETDA